MPGQGVSKDGVPQVLREENAMVPVTMSLRVAVWVLGRSYCQCCESNSTANKLHHQSAVVLWAHLARLFPLAGMAVFRLLPCSSHAQEAAQNRAQRCGQWRSRSWSWSRGWS